MAIESVTKLVAVLNQCRLLEPPQLDEVVRRLQPQYRDPRALAKELLQRGWITPYHVNTLFGTGGKVSDLVLGQYVLLEKIGEGGMGQVFKARHLKLNRVVALKVVRKEWLTQPQAVQRFQREIRSAAQLSHANIVMAYDADQLGDTHFIAMEYVEGVDLGKLLKQSGAVPVPLACDYVRQTALGLQHALEKGMVHRDIKPSNLLLTRGGSQGSDSGTQGRWGTVKILDMGLARVRASEDDAGGGTLTQAGAVVGTPDYISPEQARDSRTVDIRADLYSLGCTFYHLLAGQVPFPGGTGMEKLFKHQLEEARPVEKVNPAVPAGVAAVVRKLLAKKPEDRYQTPAELVAVLEPFCHGDAPAPVLPKKRKSGIPPPADPTEAFVAAAAEQYRPTRSLREDATPTEPAPIKKPRLVPAVERPRRRLSKRWIVVPLAALVLLVLLVIVVWPRNAADPSVDLGKPTEPGSKATSPGTSPATGPVAASRSPLDALNRERIPAEERPGLPREVVAVLGDSRLRHWGAVSALTFSPNGQALASAGYDRHLRVWDLNSGRQVAAFPTGANFTTSLTYLPDGKGLASASHDNTIRVTVQGAAAESIPLPADSPVAALAPDGRTAVLRGRDLRLHLYDLGAGQDRWVSPAGLINPVPAYSADGQMLAVFARQASGEEASVLVLDAATGKELHRLAIGKEIGYSLAVTGDLVALAGPKGVQVWSTTTGQKLYGRDASSGMATSRLTFTPDGKTLLVAGSDGLHQLDAATGKERGPTLVDLRFVAQLAVSRDGRTLAAVSGNDCRIGIYDLATGQERLAPANGQRAGFITTHLVGDGRWLLTGASFYSTTIKAWDVVNGQERGLVTAEPGGMAWIAGTTPASTLALVRLTDAFVSIDVTSGAIKGRYPVPRTSSAQAVLAPNGKTVVLTTYNDSTIQVLDFPSMEKHSVLKSPENLGLPPSFSADGQTLLAADTKGNLRIWDLATGKERAHGIPPVKAPIFSVALSPDGKTVAASLPERWIKMWSAETGQQRLASQEPPPRDVTRGPGGNAMLRFSPDGDTLMAWNYQSVRFWQVSTGKPRPTPQLPANVAVGMPVFAPDGRSIAMPDMNARLTFYDVATGHETQGMALPGATTGLAFSSDGRYLATANANGTSYILRLEPRPTALRPDFRPKPLGEGVLPLPGERLKERLKELKPITSDSPPKE